MKNILWVLIIVLVVVGFGVHVWAVSESQKGWRPGGGSYYCNATTRHGKIEKSGCR
jgi:uncharacterized protein YxeA